MRLILAASLALSALSVPTIAPAQERVLTVFGDDRCPENTICVRAPEGERFRIPKELRPGSSNPANQSWATRSQGVVSVGNTAPSACEPASNHSGAGCLTQEMRKAREETRARKKLGSEAP